MGADAVFISYSHDSQPHSDRMLELSNNLRAMGIDAELDQYHAAPPEGWPQWCDERLRPENSKYVLVVCTPTYRERVENKAPADEGRGAFWEGKDIYQYIYDEKTNTRFIPVLLGVESEESIPRRLRGYANYRLKAFGLDDPGFEALYRRLTNQPAVVKPALGEKAVLGTKSPSAQAAVPAPAVGPALPKQPVLTAFAPPPPPPVDISRIDRYAPKELVGRDRETKLIDDAWAKAVAGDAPRPRVMAFVALGGEGKTALVAKWAVGMAEKGWPTAEAAFGWSFYSQGSSEQQAASSDLFLAEALKFFGAPAVEGDSPHDKGRRLAARIGAKRAALILDGLEPLQYPPTSPLAGQLKDQGLSALLKGLAQNNNGLCLLTTRYRIRDIEAYAAAAPQRDLSPLAKTDGARLLERLEVKGTQKEREKLSEDVKGHALTLTILGAYLRDAYSGDIQQRDRIRLGEADAEEQGGHAFRAMDAYAEWFESDGENGQRALAMLRLLGLFDRPADAGCLAALWRGPPIEGLTEPLIGLSEAQRNIVLSRLAGAKLVTVNRVAGALVSLDAHPLLREYFAKALREKRPEAWKAAHKRIYEHLTTTTKDKDKPTLDDLQPLYQAVAHGCFAGMQQEACEKVYRDRILRGTDSGAFYSTKKLGAYGADLGAVACFFDLPWNRVSPNLPPPYQAWLLNQAAFNLRALGRVTEALEPVRASVENCVNQENWRSAALAASNLSDLELTLGEVETAVRDGEAAIAYADRAESLDRIGTRASLARALHEAGQYSKAEQSFEEAEALQAELQPTSPLLYSLRGFNYCDWLLMRAERAAWRVLVKCNNKSDPRRTLIQASAAVSDRATQTLGWMEAWTGAALLTIGLDHLTLARSALYSEILDCRRPGGDHLREAAHFVRRSGNQDDLPRVLLTRALFCAVTRDFYGAREDLDEAYEIAERGPMRLHLTDIHLHRARLFGLMASRPAVYPWTSPRADLDAAKKLIDECGYGRRRDELADAEAAYERLFGARR